MARAMQRGALKWRAANDDDSVKVALRDQPIALLMTPSRSWNGSAQGGSAGS